MGQQHLAKKTDEDEFKVSKKTIAILTAIVAGIFLFFWGLPFAHAADPTTQLIDPAEIQNLKSLIISCLSFITVIGTAYLTVLVGVSAFSLIRKVIRG
ncbi:hypothetical protein [Acinetobacter proteolyticus]|uniref:Uncharacterized protein n=1 Tax=Acinetobacter proteolyticus TaxID=1776741 RepID=A0A2N0WA79_9GAMM|nr:hypothetical protein [Acinetobacter proteolyticus]PKF31327.1 hypothetical protein CW311_19430 [Acinetobacter proteolyticus]